MSNRLFEKIVEKLRREAFRTKKIWHRKSAWNEMKMMDGGKFATSVNIEKAVNVIEKQIKLFCEDPFKNGRGGGKEFCSLRKIITKASKEEARMERALVISVPALYNRFNFLSGLTAKEYNGQAKHMTVDLVNGDKNCRVVNSFIELKAGNNTSENPLSALCEVVMYFLLFKKVKEKTKLPIGQAKQFKLVVLAPKEYYRYFDDDQDSDMRKKIASSMTKCLGITCEFENYRDALSNGK
ncbi:MAG: hypothetical protein HYZ83_03175 [Candidatus Omnitrophica bacterium]|nr:hypothetical protein [Candidatus Omnitrophota bacterium]